MSQLVIGPATSAPTTTASVAAARANSGARRTPMASASAAHAIAVPGPPTNEMLPAMSPMNGWAPKSRAISRPVTF